MIALWLTLSSTCTAQDKSVGDTNPPTTSGTQSGGDSSQTGSSEQAVDQANDDDQVKRPIVRRPTAPTEASKLADRPPKPKFLQENKAAKNGKTLDLTFDDLAFEMKPDEKFDWSMITDEILSYDGQKITLRGFIKPSFSQKKIKQFVFVRDNQECCFGPGAALFDCVLVKMAEGKETDYTVRPVTIEGEFYLRKWEGPDKNVWAIYRMKNCQVK